MISCEQWIGSNRDDVQDWPCEFPSAELDEHVATGIHDKEAQ